MRAVDSLAGRIDAVVIGTSAGGIEALSILLPALPLGLRLPVLIVLHLPRERPSLLVEVLQPMCPLPVREAQDKDPIEPGIVYVAPPDYHLLVDRGPRLALSIDEAVHYSRPSIDVLFESAAETYGDRLLGIILTGANADGATGLATIGGGGGVTVVQAPETAHSSTMVQSALDRSPHSLVLSLGEIAGLLRTLGDSVEK